MTMAYTANDLQTHSRGRLLLGLGSQVKPHIERRFAMPWSNPAPRMREYISALRAIWSAWNTGERLDFRGDFYSHTLMTPFFSPGPNPWGPPKVYLAAVGEHMTRVAGEVCDGLIPHPLTTQRYLRERTIPLLEEGLAASGRTLGRLLDQPPGARRHRPHRGGDGDRRRRRASPDRVLRQHPRVPGRCSSCTAGAISAWSSTGSPAAPTTTAGCAWAS